MKVGDLVYFSAQHLAYDFEQLRGQYGLLLECVEIGGRGDKTYRGWKTLWVERKLVVWEQDISLVEPNEI